MYLTPTIHDLTFSVCLINKYMEKPITKHLQVIKKIMRYLSVLWKLVFGTKKSEADELITYADSDYNDDVDDKKNTSNNVSAGISWST